MSSVWNETLTFKPRKIVGLNSLGQRREVLGGRMRGPNLAVLFDLVLERGHHVWHVVEILTEPARGKSLDQDE